MRFHLIDRIDSWEPDKRIAARKVTAAAEEFWQRGPDGPVMPPPLVLEALCQAGAWLVLMSTEHRRRAALLSIDQVSFLADVVPGEVLLLEGRVTAISGDVAVLDGAATVGGRPVLVASGIMCALVAAELLDDPEATRRMGEQLARISQ
jgi:3-hydroxyacyl-[acyl-carrier-protein] dehydratase